MEPTTNTAPRSADRARRRSGLLLFLSLGALALVAACRGAGGEDLVEVVRVQDGDSVILKIDGADKRARLQGIDAPESDQPFGEEATAALKALLKGGRVKVHSHGEDRYQRLLATLHTPEGEPVNLRLVEGGFAWHYEQFSDDPDLARAQEEARRLKRGLWADAEAEAPWEFRRNRSGRKARRNRKPVAIDAATEIIGNRRSRKYHLKHCPGFSTTAPHNRVLFESEAAARAKGFERAGNCNP